MGDDAVGDKVVSVFDFDIVNLLFAYIFDRDDMFEDDLIKV